MIRLILHKRAVTLWMPRRLNKLLVFCVAESSLDMTMSNQWLTRIFIAIGIVSIFISLKLLGVNFSHPEIFTISSVVFIIWLMLPYLVWAFINEHNPNSFPKRRLIYVGLAIAMPIIGFAMVGYTSLHSDSQAGFFILYIPLIQFICLGFTWEVCKK